MAKRLWFVPGKAWIVSLILLCTAPIYAQRGGGGGHGGGHGGGVHGGGVHGGHSHVGYGYGGHSHVGHGYGGVYTHGFYGYRNYPNFYGTRYGYYSYPRITVGLGAYPFTGYLGTGLYGTTLYGSGLGGFYGPGFYDPRFYGTGVYSSGAYYSYPGYGYYGSSPILNYSSRVLYPPTAVATAENPTPQPPGSPATGRDDYLQAARVAFQAGEYANAQRLVNHAIVEAPDNAKAHELLSLSLFAAGDFRGAAAAAHAAISMAPPADWPTVYRYYNDKDKYTQNLRALEKFVKENPDSIDGRFLLGVHRVMLGHKDEAKREFGEYLRLVRDDPVAEKLYLDMGGKREDLPRAIEPPIAPPPPPGDARAELPELRLVRPVE